MANYRPFPSIVNLPSGGSFVVYDHTGAAIAKFADGSPDTAKLGVGLQVYAGTAGPTSVDLLTAGSGTARASKRQELPSQ